MTLNRVKLVLIAMLVIFIFIGCNNDTSKSVKPTATPKEVFANRYWATEENPWITKFIINDTTRKDMFFIKKASVKEGDSLFPDRLTQFSGLPKVLDKAIQIWFPGESKNFREEVLATFVAKMDLDLFIGYRSDNVVFAPWLFDFEDLKVSFTMDGIEKYDLFKMSYKKGDKIVLGNNGDTTGNSGMYVAFIKPKQ